jgi:hypothetical protein
MRIINISDAPSVCDEDGNIRRDITDLNRILNRIDDADGRNDCLREYILALRDLQRAHELSMFEDLSPQEEREADIDKAQVAVDLAFDDLIAAQSRLSADNGGKTWAANTRSVRK